MQLFNLAGHLFLKALVGLLSITLVIVLWYQASGLIVWLLDFNLWAIKTGCAFLPRPYGAMVESLLRGALAADKAFLFAEGALAVKAFFAGARHAFASDRPTGKLVASRH